MTERHPGSMPAGWDRNALRDALDPADTIVLPCPAIGRDDPGFGFVLGDPPRAMLELYPSDARLVVRAPGLRLELDGLITPTIGPEGVVFERSSPAHALWLSLGRTGEIAVQYAPTIPLIPDDAETPTSPVVASDRAIGRLTPEPAADGLPAAPDGPSTPASSSPSAEGNAERQERVRLFGRLATEVRFKEREGRPLIGEFVLAERLDDESTRFHQIAAFDNPKTNRLVATRLKAQVDAGELGKGKPATVVGYRHERERTKRDGTTATEAQIYAVAISAR